MHQIIDVIDVFGTFIAAPYHNFLIVMQIAFRHFLYVAAHRCREKQRVAIVGELLKNGVDTIRKAHVKHLIGLIEHHIVHFIKHHYATINQVNQAPWRSNNDLCTMLNGLHLWANVGTSIHGYHMKCIDVLAEIF